MSVRATANPSRYLTAEEAAEYLRLSPRTLEKHRNLGTGPRFRKLGRMIRYTILDLDVWADARSFDMTEDADDSPVSAQGAKR